MCFIVFVYLLRYLNLYALPSLIFYCLSLLVTVKYLAANRLIKKFHESIGSGCWWVVYNVGHSSKFYSIRYYKLYSERTVYSSVTCWHFSRFPVAGWGGAFSCSCTRWIVSELGHLFFSWDFFWFFPPAATFSPYPDHRSLLATMVWLLWPPWSLARPWDRSGTAVQSCRFCVISSTWQNSLSCSGSHPLPLRIVCTILLKST